MGSVDKVRLAGPVTNISSCITQLRQSEVIETQLTVTAADVTRSRTRLEYARNFTYNPWKRCGRGRPSPVM